MGTAPVRSATHAAVTPGMPLLSLIVPTRGDAARLGPFLDALALQTAARETYEILLVADGVALPPAIAARATALGARVVTLAEHQGPGAARNAGAAAATGAYLAFTEDDVTPAPGWLARAAARLAADPTIDVLEGATTKPGRDAPHRGLAGGAVYLPTNLFVRRTLFGRVGGYSEQFFDAARGLYFREDADFGFTLEEAGARVAREPAAVVSHPEELTRWGDPLRWAARHEMDPLLARRHPRLFRERIEVHPIGPFRVRRPIVRASVGVVVCTFGALVAWALGAVVGARALALLAGVLFLPVWAKWRFSPVRLPVAVLVPFALTLALTRGTWRVWRERR